MAKQKNARLAISINDKGEIKIDTNLSALGAIHIMASAQQIIIQQQVEARAEESNEEKEVN